MRIHRRSIVLLAIAALLGALVPAGVAGAASPPAKPTASRVVFFAADGTRPDLLQRYAAGVVANSWGALVLTVLSSALLLFLFLVSAYYRLTNARLSQREVLPGAIVGAVALALTLQGLPLFVYASSDIVALKALGTTFLLLVWLYVMANVIVFGAALNYETAYGQTGAVPQPKRGSTPPTPRDRH